MKSVVRKLLFYIAGIGIIGIVLSLAYHTYFVEYLTSSDVMVDVFGRTSYVAPWEMQLLRIPGWPALPWFLVDLAVFIFGIGFGLKLITTGHRKDNFSKKFQ